MKKNLQPNAELCLKLMCWWV